MPVLLQEGRLLHARKACSQIQKGPFFFFNTHALHSCGAKQIYIKIKYSSPSHAFHSPHPFPFHPHSTPFPSPAHSPLSVTPRTCSSVTLSPLAYNLLTRLPINSSTCPLLLELVHLLPCLFSPPTCSPVPLSPVFLPCQHHLLAPYPALTCKLFLSSYFFVGTSLKHCNANSSLFVTHFYLQKHNYQ